MAQLKIKRRDDADNDGPVATQNPLADCRGDLIARRETILAQARVDAERWVDEGGGFRAEAAPTTNSPTVNGKAR